MAEKPKQAEKAADSASPSKEADKAKDGDKDDFDLVPERGSEEVEEDDLLEDEAKALFNIPSQIT